MPLSISQAVMDERHIPSPATLSRNAATRGSGNGRIISETTFVSRIQDGRISETMSASRSQESGVFTSRSRP